MACKPPHQNILTWSTCDAPHLAVSRTGKIVDGLALLRGKVQLLPVKVSHIDSRVLLADDCHLSQQHQQQQGAGMSYNPMPSCWRLGGRSGHVMSHTVG